MGERRWRFVIWGAGTCGLAWIGWGRRGGGADWRGGGRNWGEVGGSCLGASKEQKGKGVEGSDKAVEDGQSPRPGFRDKGTAAARLERRRRW